jgi:ABC-type multidrug transport system ATPase subunit
MHPLDFEPLSKLVSVDFSPNMHVSTRSSTLLLPDLILVMSDGQIVEQGTHDELLRKGGLYYDMWLEQASDAFASDSEADESVVDERTYDVEADEQTKAGEVKSENTTTPAQR